MRKAILLITFLLFLSPNIFAQQDPGIQDSIIIETVYVDSGATFANVPIYVETDDSVVFYQMPLAWESMNNSISAQSVSYWGNLLCWDVCYDTIMMPGSYIRMFGFSDVAGPENCYLDTHGLRMHCWTIRFHINPDAPPQDVQIDTTYDSLLGSMFFGLVDGRTMVTPAIIPGHIYYRQTTGVKDENPRPGQFRLAQNYPNPFNASTEIIFDLPFAQSVNLSIYNLLGQLVEVLVDDFKQPGRYSVNWNGADSPSGVYFYRLETSDNIQTRKMIMMK